MRIRDTDVRRVSGARGAKANGWKGGRAQLNTEIQGGLTNATVYILALEYGHSGQAPEGMVRRNMARLRAIAQEELREALRQNLDPRAALMQAVVGTIMAADYVISEATPVDTGFAKVQWEKQMPEGAT